MDSVIKSQIEEHMELVRRVYQDIILYDKLSEAANLIIKTYRNKRKVLLCGNGGSAADAEHIAAELSGKFKLDREPLFAEALHVNSAALTAIANDYGFEYVFSRMLEAKAVPSDVLVIFTTSGTSKNVVMAAKKAHEMKCKVIAFCGLYTQELENYADILISIPHKDTARIQEVYMLASHILCHLVESKLFRTDESED